VATFRERLKVNKQREEERGEEKTASSYGG
jgi:hypothetical protein